MLRGEILAAKGREYILGARALGASDLRVIARHLLPNVVTVGIIFAMSDVVLSILLGGALSFLGLGVQPPHAGMGVDDRRGTRLPADFSRHGGLPGAGLLWLGVTFNRLGDFLTDYLRPGG